MRVVREIWGSWLEGGEGGGRVGRGRERENESKTVSSVLRRVLNFKYTSIKPQAIPATR